jgi:GTPase Era involved in 16S rRNA processing
MTTVINLLGEPCAGKSTLAAGLFYLMKKKYMSVELVTEYAKDLVYDGHTSGSMSQLTIFAEQYRRVFRLVDKVDYIITDSPLSLSAFYARDNKPLSEYILSEADTFNNLNFFVNRSHAYDPNGRYQTEEQAAEMKVELRKFISGNMLDFKDVHAGDELPNWMMHGLFTTKELLGE